MSAKKTHKPQHTPPKPLKPPGAKAAAGVVPRVTAVPTGLNVHLRIHFSLPNKPGKGSWPRKTRWQPEQVVTGATITVHGTSVTKKTDALGDAYLPIAALTGDQRMTISPHTDEISLAPAGPGHGKTIYNDSARYYFRPFDVAFIIKDGKFSLTPPPTILLVPSPVGPPPHAALFDVTASDLTIDWKPDWVKTLNTSAADNPPPPPQVNDCLVLHQTSSPGKIGSVINTFNNKKVDGKPSAHYVIDVDGHVVKTLHESWEANHVGPSFWQGRLSMNSCSIGVEIVHTDLNKAGKPAPRDFTEAQYAALLRLVPEIRVAHPLITRQRIVGHGDVEIKGPKGGTMHHRIGDDRAGDPGNQFDWPRLERAGMTRVMLSGAPPAAVYGIGPGQIIRPNHQSHGVARLQGDLAAIGYSINNADGITVTGTYDDATRRAVQRFRIRYFSGSRLVARPNAPKDWSLDFETAFAIHQVLADRGP